MLQAAANFGFLHADMHALAFASDGSKLYLGNDGGVYSTTQITATNPVFTALNSTLATAQFYPGFPFDPANVANAIGFVFVALPLTAFGSPSYPLSPNNSRLLWDRPAMTIALMSMVAARSADKAAGW